MPHSFTLPTEGLTLLPGLPLNSKRLTDSVALGPSAIHFTGKQRLSIVVSLAWVTFVAFETEP